MNNNIIIERLPGRTISRTPNISTDEVLGLVEEKGEALKISKKSSTMRVGDFILKRSLTQGCLGLCKRTFQRSRYRQGWEASLFLKSHGISVPKPYAFIEYGVAGIVSRNILVSQYLDGYMNVEHYAATIKDENRIENFLSVIANAVNELVASGAYHSDLSGKNIFTVDGTSVVFIDLDGVILNCMYTDKLRIKNHIQLYDSFCDLWGDDFLASFISQMMQKGKESSVWLEEVKKGQAARRSRTVAIRRKRGIG